MPVTGDSKEYKASLREALDNEFLRRAMDNFAVAYPESRKKAFAGMEVEDLIREIAAARDEGLTRLDFLYEQFKANAEKLGVSVCLAETADEANEIIAVIAKKNGVKKIVKSKSMTAEETLLNHHLEEHGLEVTETDLGEWIIQLRHEGPSHMVMPAIHLSRYQVADLFTAVTSRKQDSEIEKLVKVARRELRRKFVEADMGITGANFALADSGTLGIVTNEGNARLVTTLPGIHVALVGLEKLTPNLKDALRVLKVLPRNATGQALTSYVTWITGPAKCRSAPDGVKQMHIIFLDNGRRAMVRDPLFRQVLRCVRCGACANVCPVYRLVGGHQYGHIYIGAIGLILTYFFHGRDKAGTLVKNCLNCGACKAVCAAGIDLPALIKEVLARVQNEKGHPLESRLLGLVLKNRKLFHSLLRSAGSVQKPMTDETGYLRHLPQILSAGQDFRALPPLADRPFRDLWPEIKPKEAGSGLKIGLFSGCLQDFVYPEQLAAAVKLLDKCGVRVDFPMDQSCCGLPVMMMGEKRAARDVALLNLKTFAPGNYDYIVTLCASCASHLKNTYPRLLEEGSDKVNAREFSDKVIDFSSLVRNVLKVDSLEFNKQGPKTAYHAPCHLCRGLGVTEAPRKLLEIAGLDYRPSVEEDVCCGFGGTYSANFPELSSRILNKKLDHLSAGGAEVVVSDCPGCVMQIRGGFEKRGSHIRVKHIAEVIGDQLE